MSSAPALSVSSRNYDFHGVALSISTDQPRLLEAIDRRLALFARGEEGSGGLTFSFRTALAPPDRALLDPPAAARVVYDPADGAVLYSDEEDALYLTSRDRVWARSAPAIGRTDVVGLAAIYDDQWLMSRPLLTLPLIEALKRRGLFSLHAAGASVNGRTVLIAGRSGAGKSTLAAALVRAGFDFVSDDMVFLAEREGRLRIHAFPDESDLTDESLELLPELAASTAGPKRAGWPKRQVRLEEAYGATVAWCSTPAAVVLPHVDTAAAVSMVRIKADEALLDLAPNVLLTDVSASQRHLDVLAALVSTTPCYRFTVGRDLATAVAEVRQLLHGANLATQ